MSIVCTPPGVDPIAPPLPPSEGEFLQVEVTDVDGSGRITGFSIEIPGNFYRVGEELEAIGGSGTGATIIITQVGAQGEVEDLIFNNQGINFQIGDELTFRPIQRQDDNPDDPDDQTIGAPDPDDPSSIDDGSGGGTGGFNVTDVRPTCVAFFAGRVFYAGFSGAFLTDKVFFSQILTTRDKAEKCYQDADPTSEELSDLVDTDGGEISIAGMGQVSRMMPVGMSLVVFASNGIWEIMGESDNFFRATGYMTRNITSVPVQSPKSVVEVEGVVFFWGEDGIYLLQPNDVTGALNATSITEQSIKSFYNNLSSETRRNAVGCYDYKTKKIIWLYNDREPFSKFYNKALVFDLQIGGFTKYVFSEQNEGIELAHAVQVRNISKDIPAIKYMYVSKDGDKGQFTFLSLDKNGFNDLNFPEQPSQLITGHATAGDIGVKKNAKQMILHFNRTETGFEQQGDQLLPLNPSSCKVRVTWDFTNDPASNKWGAEFQGYRYRSLYTPTGPDDDFNTGYEVVSTKTKIRGTGRALSVHFNSEEGKDMQLLGWSIIGDAEQNE